MHELGLCRQIIEIVQRHAAGRKCSRIKKIIVELGALSAVDTDALLFCFDAAAANTMAQGAVLEIIPVEGKAVCDSCKKTVKIVQLSDACEYCGNFALSILQGEELRVKSMEVE